MDTHPILPWGKKLYHEGYVYTKIESGRQFWRCKSHKAGCPARATSERRSVVVRKEHNHPPDSALTTTQLALAGMREGQSRKHIHQCDLR